MIWMVILVVLVLAWILLSLWLNQEVSSPVEVRNRAGAAGRALVVDHPGRGTFHPRVVAGFVEGLVAGGWQVAVTTAHAGAPTDLAEYDLLVLGSPIYDFAPSRAIRRYLGRLGDLDGQPTVTLLSGLGAGGRASAMLQRQVQEANGRPVKALVLYRMRPNDEENYVDGAQNRALAVDMARQAAEKVAASRAEWGS
jgi:hypothetical protein